MGQGRLRLSLLVLLCAAQGCSHHSGATASEQTQLAAQKQALALLNSNQYAALDRQFSGIQHDYENGTIDDEDLRAAFRAFYVTSPELESHYDGWMEQFPKSYVAHLARGIYYKRIAEERRGTGFVRETSSEQFRGMEAHFAKSEQDLRASAELDSKPLLTYLHAMDIASYLGDTSGSRQLMDAAIRIDPRNFIVREKYMTFLEPRWGGSVEQMRALLDESRKAGLSAAQIQKLEAVITADQAAPQH